MWLVLYYSWMVFSLFYPHWYLQMLKSSPSLVQGFEKPAEFEADVSLLFDFDMNKDFEDTLVAVSPNFSGEVSTKIDYSYYYKKMEYSIEASYSAGFVSEKDAVIVMDTDDLDFSNEVVWEGEDLSTSLSFSIQTQLFRKKENELVVSRCLSPAIIDYSLGLEYAFDGIVRGAVKMNFASFQSALFIDQSLYDNKGETQINNVEKGKYISTTSGLSVDYSIGKTINNMISFKNTGSIFFPGQERLFSSAWLDDFKVQLSNEINFFRRNKFKISLITKVDYNRYYGHNLDFYTKLAVGVTIR